MNKHLWNLSVGQQTPVSPPVQTYNMLMFAICLFQLAPSLPLQEDFVYHWKAITHYYIETSGRNILTNKLTPVMVMKSPEVDCWSCWCSLYRWNQCRVQWQEAAYNVFTADSPAHVWPLYELRQCKGYGYEEILKWHNWEACCESHVGWVCSRPQTSASFLFACGIRISTVELKPLCVCVVEPSHLKTNWTTAV